MKDERPRPGTEGAASDALRQHHSTPATDPDQAPVRPSAAGPPEAAELPPGVRPLAEILEELVAKLPALRAVLDRQAAPPRLAYRLGEIAAALGVSKRLLEQERAAGRLPKPDLRIGRVSLWRVDPTIRDWLSQQADRLGRRSKP
jgi:hypothetical protein